MICIHFWQIFNEKTLQWCCLFVQIIDKALFLTITYKDEFLTYITVTEFQKNDLIRIETRIVLFINLYLWASQACWECIIMRMRNFTTEKNWINYNNETALKDLNVLVVGSIASGAIEPVGFHPNLVRIYGKKFRVSNISLISSIIYFTKINTKMHTKMYVTKFMSYGV